MAVSAAIFSIASVPISRNIRANSGDLGSFAA
jgi:hypothetical protein